MGVYLSIEHGLSTEKPDNRSIMIFMYEKSHIKYVSFVDFLLAPLDYVSYPILIIEPSSANIPTVVAPPISSMSLNDTMRVFHQQYKIKPYTIPDYRMWLCSSHSLSKTVLAETSNFLKTVSFSSYRSTLSIDPTELFFDIKGINSMMQALRPPSNSIRASSPLKSAGQISTTGVLGRRSHNFGPFPNTFFIPPVVPVTTQYETPPCCVNDDINLVVPHLYIGNERAAVDKDLLASLNITHIVNISGDITSSSVSDNIKCFIVKLNDSVFESLDDAFWEAVTFTKNAIDNESNVLVHCRRGISRSAALCLAYLMQYRNMTLESALTLIQKQRPQISINQGFITQLKAKESSFRRSPIKNSIIY